MMFCVYPPAIGSIMICTTVLNGRTDKKFIEIIAKRLSNQCGEYSTESYSWDYYYDQYYNSTEPSNYISYADIEDPSKPIYKSSTPDLKKKNFARYIYLKNYYEQLDVALYFAIGILGYFLFLITIGAVYNFTRETTIAKFLNDFKLAKLIQCYVIFPTLLPNGKFKQAYGKKYLSILIPNRGQFLVDLILCVLQLAFYCVPYPKDGIHRNYLKLIGHRSGILSFGKIPLLILFSGRNNFLIWLTGWSYSTFLHYHKVVALWMFFDAMVHSAVWTICEIGIYVKMLKKLYFACGVAATVLGGIMIGQSLYPFRKLAYEFFLITHIVLAVAFIAMCWYHCNHLGWMEWLVAACCVWFFDRFFKIIKMARFGFRTAFLSVVDDNLLKIEVDKPAWTSHIPGHYYYIYFAGRNFCQNHPFSTVQEGIKLCTYIRVKTGMTKKVFDTVLKNGGKMDWKVCYEGPYGGNCARKLERYNDTLLIAGGSGVPAVLESATRVSSGKMVWIAQTLSSIKAYKPLFELVHTDLELYITRENDSDMKCTLNELFTESNSETETSSKDTLKAFDNDKQLQFTTKTGNVTIRYCRPNVVEIVSTYLTSCSSSNVGIFACGPPQLMDNLRHVVCANVTTWGKSIDFFDEYQSW